MPEAKIAKLPLKDANDMLKEGRDKECFNIVMFQAKNRLSGKMVSSDDLWGKAKERPAHGVSWPWPEMTALTRGIRTKEGYYVGAGVKMGKSCVVNALATHFIVEHGEKVFLCKPEEAPVVTARKLAGYAKGRIFDDPNIEFDEIAFDEGAEIIGDNAILYDSYQKTEWKDVKEAIRQAVIQHGCKRVIIDPITCFTVGVSAAERNEILIEIASEIAAMSMELDFTYFIFCHLNKPDSGKPHERGGDVQSVQFAGSRGMMRSCHYMIGLEGNKDPDLSPEQRNCRDLVLLEDRNFGESGRVKLWYNRKTGHLNQLTQEQEESMNEVTNP
jgi:twinkle protein